MSAVTITREGEACQVKCLNPTKVKRLAKMMPAKEQVAELSDLFQLLSDPNRIKTLFALSHDEVCVCDLSAILGMSDSAVSHQLRLLRALRLVKSRRDGRIIYYSLADNHVTKLLEMSLQQEGEAR
ncbi:MAG: metalloregulator ArsR/SmtB family transcription factor [Candidatus Bathyarchaeia archaeon]